jgi:Flp pilus assembly protein TadG
MMELALVAILFGMMIGGILEFGRAWSAANVLNAAARDAARTAAVTAAANNRQAAVESRVKATAGSYFAPGDLSVLLSTSTDAGGQPMVTVAATGKVNTVFGTAILGKKISMTRTVSLRDETLAP